MPGSLRITAAIVLIFGSLTLFFHDEMLIKIKPTALAAVTAAVAEDARRHPAAHPQLIPTSSETKAGIAELRAAVVGAAFA